MAEPALPDPCQPFRLGGAEAEARRGGAAWAGGDHHPGAWQPLDPARTYKLFVLSFNANGGDGYQTLAAVPAARRLDIGVLDSDVFFNYIESLPTRNAAGRPVIGKLPVELYSTKTFTAPAAP